MKMPLFDSHQYEPVKTGESSSSSHRLAAEWKRRASYGLLLLTVLLMAATGGYLVGSRPNTDLLAPIGHIDHTFYYNKHFGKHPDEDSDHWWQKVVPKGRGFIYNPDISSDPVGLSVFHQLHCLDAIRRSYYAIQDGTQELSNHTKPGHVRHCIDYLRQSIMCHADTNLEPIDPELGGVTGWGSPRKCRDIVGLIEWANKWRTHNQTSIE